MIQAVVEATGAFPGNEELKKKEEESATLSAQALWREL